jgi:hypothetical protein
VRVPLTVPLWGLFDPREEETKFRGKLTSSYVKDCDIVLDECEDDKDEQNAKRIGLNSDKIDNIG